MTDGAPLKTKLDAALAEARTWLRQQQLVANKSDDHANALGLFERYLNSVEGAVAPPGIRIASRALSWKIADQLEWSAAYCVAISNFHIQLDGVGREMERARSA